MNEARESEMTTHDNSDLTHADRLRIIAAHMKQKQKKNPNPTPTLNTPVEHASRAIHNYLAKIGSKGGKVTAARGNAFTSERGRAAARARWSAARKVQAAHAKGLKG